MSKLEFQDVVSSVKSIPAISPIFTDLINSINNDNTDIDSIAKKISCDQALTVKILSLANSSFYGMSHQVASIHDAITILGFNNIRMMIATSVIIDIFKNNDDSDYFGGFWRHSIGTAICAHEIAMTKHIKTDYAFIGGLIHDIGKLVLATQYSEQYQATLKYQAEHECDSHTAERTLLGIDHCEIGTELGKHWHFPEPLCAVISGHHRQAANQTHPIVAVIHLADIIVTGLDISNNDFARVPEINPTLWEQIQLDDQDCQQIFDSTIKKFTEIEKILLP